jgi:hypothetical protein
MFLFRTTTGGIHGGRLTIKRKYEIRKKGISIRLFLVRKFLFSRWTGHAIEFGPVPQPFTESMALVDDERGGSFTLTTIFYNYQTQETATRLCTWRLGN